MNYLFLFVQLVWMFSLFRLFLSRILLENVCIQNDLIFINKVTTNKCGGGRGGGGREVEVLIQIRTDGANSSINDGNWQLEEQMEQQ